MRTDIYQRLPSPLKTLVDEIESSIPFEIQVITRRDRPAIVVAEAREQTLGSLISFDAAIIETYGAIEDISDVGFAHELLHLRRTFVERVPHIYPRKASNSQDAANFDNWLEHVVIYDRQLDLCPDNREQINSELIDFWGRCPWGLSGAALNFNLLTRLMITRRYGSVEARHASLAAMNKLPAGHGASRAARETLALVNNKRAFVRSVFKYCDIPPSFFWLRRCEPALGKNILEDF